MLIQYKPIDSSGGRNVLSSFGFVRKLNTLYTLLFEALSVAEGEK